MNAFGLKTPRAKGSRTVAVALLLAVILVGATGLSCGDVPFSSATFRDAAMSEIQAGVKSVVNGLLDGLFAVLADAGRGGSGGSTSN